MKYNSHLNYKKRKRFMLKVRIFLALVLVTLIAGGVMFYLKYVRESNPNTPDKTTSEVTTVTTSPSINPFRTSYFQFLASNDWAEVSNESTANKFVYRKIRAGLVEHDLTIYVNQIPENLQPTNVLPVTSDGGNTLNVLQISDNCSSKLNKEAAIKDVQTVNMSGVEFLCYGKINAFNVIVGLQGGTTAMNLKRLDGTTAVYTIYYRDLRAVSGPDEVYQIIRTFQTR